jgi:Domain of unknown function (DUF4156)
MATRHSHFVSRCGALTVAVSTLALAGCHNVKLSPEAESVRVLRDASQVSGCRFVRDVDSSDRLSGGLIFKEKSEENAYKILKQKTAELHANTVVIVTATSGLQGAVMKGKAYTCN